MKATKRTSSAMSSGWFGASAATAVLFCLAAAGAVTAGPYVLEDLNSTAVIDPDSSNGVLSWIVDDTENLAKQWFWVRIGEGAEQSIDSIDADGPLVNHLDNDFDPGKESLQLRYEGAALQIDVSLKLVGGAEGSGISDMAEAISVTNMSDGELVVHFYQYVDLNLGGVAGDDTVEAVPPFGVVQTSGAGWVSETADTPAVSRYEVGLVPVILNKLNDGDADDLANIVGPVGGDVCWAFQWDFELGPGGSFILSKDKHLVIPEPATVAILLVGGLAALSSRGLGKRHMK